MNDQMLKACDLYARTSRGPGSREYWVGYLGALKVLIFRVNNPAEDGPVYTLHLAARPPRQEQPARGQAPHDAARESAANWSPQQRERYAADLAAQFVPDEEP